MDWFHSLWKIRFYVLFAALTYGGFVWAGLSGRRLLGDDNEAEQNLNGNGGSHGSGGRATYFHK